MESDDDKPAGEPEDIPRKSFWASMPKRSFTRILILLVALLGIIYLRERTSSIAGCMSSTLRALPPPAMEAPGSATRARIELRTDAAAKSSR